MEKSDSIVRCVRFFIYTGAVRKKYIVEGDICEKAYTKNSLVIKKINFINFGVLEILCQKN